MPLWNVCGQKSNLSVYLTISTVQHSPQEYSRGLWTCQRSVEYIKERQLKRESWHCVSSFLNGSCGSLFLPVCVWWHIDVLLSCLSAMGRWLCKSKNWSEAELKQSEDRTLWAGMGNCCRCSFGTIFIGRDKIYKLKTAFSSTHIFQVHTIWESRLLPNFMLWIEFWPANSNSE